MDRRLVIKNAGIAGVLAAGIAPAIQAQAPAANIRWRLASSFPKALDTIYGAAETFAKKVGEMSGGKFVITVHAGGLIRWPAYVLIPLGFALLLLQALSEMVKRVAFLRGEGPDVLNSEDSKSDEQKHLEELEAKTARLLAGDK